MLYADVILKALVEPRTLVERAKNASGETALRGSLMIDP